MSDKIITEYGTNLENILECLTDISVRKMVFGKLGEISVEKYLQQLHYKIIQPDKSKIPTPWDLKLVDAGREISIQVKTIRRTDQGKVPVLASSKLCRAVTSDPKSTYLIHTYKTRNGKDKQGNQTRNYTLDSFDIVAVPLFPVLTWQDIRFCCSYDLIRLGQQIGKYQPVPLDTSSMRWYDNIKSVLNRFYEIESLPKENFEPIWV